MIKQSFLDSLTGKPLKKAKKMVKDAGHVVLATEAQAITLIARPNTVILWNDSKTVTRASAGDGLELDPS